MEKLLAEAHRKFQAGFAASQQGHASAHECAQDGAEDAAGPRPPSGRASQSSRSLLPSPFAPRDGLGRLSAAAAPPPRCSSVLGLRSSERETDGRLRRSVSPGQLSLDYVDLECLLQDKMRELNVQMPKAKSSRGKHLGDLTPSSSASPTKGDGETAEFALRVKEAAFLFRLCQQEIKLQVNISCPERSRLIDKALDFWSSVLDCLVMPLDNVREQAVTLRRKLERERALLSDVAHSLGAWSKDASHLLDASVWHQLPPQEARVVADLRAQLRAFALRSCYASATRSSARSPSPPLLSRASTSRQSKSRPVSRRCADEADQDKREEATETEGAVDGDEGLTRRGQEICGMVRLVLEGLSAACRAAVQLQQDKEDLERDLELQTQEAKDAQTLARNSHAAEQRALQQQLDDALCSHAAQRQAAQEELAAAQAACTASETLNTQLQQQVATLTESVRELEERAAAAAAEGAARVDALGAEVAAAAAGRAAAEEQLREHERLAAEERACEQGKLTAALRELDGVRDQLARFTQDGVILTPRPAWNASEDEEGGIGGGEGGMSSVLRAAALQQRLAAGKEKIGELEEQVAALSMQLRETAAARDLQSSLRLAAEEAQQKSAAELLALQERPRAEASCGCPEPPEDRQVVMVELQEYLITYLSKRFGLQGHMASWEVEKMTKDLGWIMEQPVRCSVQS
eukprot:Tamp_06754.p1 GENE.Tamp_06754~~Tamp_06754.p1  ORF type:complete len:738 (+),score=212.46 Tamp_06754:138-2216(+)